MIGINYLADTNSFIYFLDAHPLLSDFADSRWTYSYVTEIELLSQRNINIQQEAVIKSLLATCSKAMHTQEITDLTIAMRRKYSLKTPDAIIAATAQSLHLPILTADKAFSVIQEVDIFLLEI